MDCFSVLEMREAGMDRAGRRRALLGVLQMISLYSG